MVDSLAFYQESSDLFLTPVFDKSILTSSRYVME